MDSKIVLPTVISEKRLDDDVSILQRPWKLHWPCRKPMCIPEHLPVAGMLLFQRCSKTTAGKSAVGYINDGLGWKVKTSLMGSTYF